MPYTFLHPALVLPARFVTGRWRKRLSLTGLIAGSVAPDFEKFARLQSGNIYSHTLAGMFWFDLPVALVVAVLFHEVVKNPLIENLPPAWGARLWTYYRYNWLRYFRNHYRVVLASALAGIATHLGIDSATHAYGQLVQLLPPLKSYWEIGPWDLQLYQLLEILYYPLALLFTYWTWKSLPVSSPPRVTTSHRILFWSASLLVGGVVVGTRLVINSHVRHIWDLGSLLTGTGMVSVVITSLAWPRLARRT